MRFRIAIIRLSALGDVIISAAFLGFLGEIKKKFLESKDSKIDSNIDTLEIEWFIDKRFSAILQDSPVIDNLHVLDFKSKLKSLKGIFELRKYAKNCGTYDIVIDMQGLIKSAIVGKMLDSKFFIGFNFAGVRESLASVFYSKRVDINYHANILERNFALIIESLHILKLLNAIDSKDLLNLDTLDSKKFLNHALNLRKNGFSYNLNNIDSTLKTKLESKSFNILFVLEASIQEKIYPANNFIELAKMINQHQSKIIESKLDSKEITFFLAFKENTLAANEIATALNSQNITCEKLENLSFNELKFAFSKMDCVIGGDTGLTYLAWVLESPTITLYGNKDSKNMQNTNLQDCKIAKISNKNSSKNMRNTDLKRILLGNPYIVSHTNTFEIASILPSEIFNTFKTQILKQS